MFEEFSNLEFREISGILKIQSSLDLQKEHITAFQTGFYTVLTIPGQSLEVIS